jgi:short-subunit dehydrogenase
MVTLITGASSGIGKALAFRYAQAGAQLVLGARNLAQLEQIQKQIQAQHPRVQVVVQTCDVTQPQHCQALVHTALQQFGRLDVLINNAGISMRAPLLEVETQVLQNVMDVNFWGTVHCTQAALPHLVKTQGSVVGVSSIAGFVGLPERAGYSASKFAMHGYLESLRTEMRPHQVHVLLACPGFTASNIRERALTAKGTQQGSSPRPEEKLMTAEAVADEIFRAQQARKRTLILTRKGKLTVWTKKLLPAWLEKKVEQEFEKERRWEQQQPK